VAARDAAASAAHADSLLASQPDLSRDAREYLVVAGMAGYLGAGKRAQAKLLWDRQEKELRNPGRPLLRLLRCHAEPAGTEACAAAFANYAG
jgi:hypothetical protein